jgi:hypothetical protein
MTLVFYRPDGSIAFTADGDEVPPTLDMSGLALLSTEQPLGDLEAWAVIEGALELVSLEPARARARADLAGWISAARAQLITDLPGQDMVYLAKEAEARAWVSEATPDIADYPLLSAEVGITAPDADQLAQLWLNMAALWRSTAAQLEALRLSAQAAIAAAESEAEIAAALAVLE